MKLNNILNNIAAVLSRNQKGIYVTLIFHFLILNALLIFKISEHRKPREAELLFDFSSVEPDLQELTPEERVDLTRKIQQQTRSDIKNIGVNEREGRLLDQLDKNVDVYKEALEVDRRLHDAPQSQIPDTEVLEEATHHAVRQEVSKPATGIVAVSYNVPNRNATKLPKPTYQCTSYGEVVVNVEINPKGYVIRAVVNKTKSNTSEFCLCESAVRYAKLSRFSILEKKNSRGTISYRFAAQ